MRTSVAAVVLILMSFTASAQDGDAEFQAKLDAINQKYEKIYEDQSKRGEEIKKESQTCLIDVGFDSAWEETKIAFDYPQMTMKTQSIKFDVPQTTFRTQNFSYDTIDIGTSTKCRWVGVRICYEEPYTRSRRVDWNTKIPEFKWDTTEIKLDIPEFKMVRKEWKFHILKLKKLTKLDIPCKKEEEKAQNLSEETNATVAQHQTEVRGESATFIRSKMDELTSVMAEADSQFVQGVAGLSNAIDELNANKVDPHGVRIEIEPGKELNLYEARDFLEQQRVDALGEMRKQFDELQKQLEEL